MEANKISVVIVSFHRAAALRRSLAALIGSSLQIIVVDNGSRDGAANLDDEFPEARFIRLPRNFGLTRALNIGIRSAEGDYTLLLHDDVVIEGPAVIALAEFLENRPDVTAVCPLLNGPQIRLLPTRSEPDPPFRSATAGDEVQAECVSGAAVMVRTAFLRSMGHIDERYGNYGCDVELCAQLSSSNRKIIVLRQITATHDAQPSPMPKGILESDRVTGTAAFIGKRYGFAAGLMYRLKMLLTFRFAAVSAKKIDGLG